MLIAGLASGCSEKFCSLTIEMTSRCFFKIMILGVSNYMYVFTPRTDKM